MYINDSEERPLILASSSPRRRSLLEQLGIQFEVIPADVPETIREGAPPAKEAQRIAEDKAVAVLGMRPQNRWILAADTIVIIDGAVLGKPRHEEEAAAMLARLAGRWHKVITGWCILHGASGVKRSGSVESAVLIKLLDSAHIRAYMKSGEPMDKAGAYAAQGIGAFMIERIEGSYTNVVGLPLAEVVEALEELGAIRLSSHGKDR